MDCDAILGEKRKKKQSFVLDKMEAGRNNKCCCCSESQVPQVQLSPRSNEKLLLHGGIRDTDPRSRLHQLYANSNLA